MDSETTLSGCRLRTPSHQGSRSHPARMRLGLVSAQAQAQAQVLLAHHLLVLHLAHRRRRRRGGDGGRALPVVLLPSGALVVEPERVAYSVHRP